MPSIEGSDPARAAPLRAVRLGAADPVLERRADGCLIIRSRTPLPRYDDNLIVPLERWAKAAPDRVFLAQRDEQNAWRKLTFAEVRASVQRIAAALLRRGLSADRPIVVLSGNDIEHALIGLAAMTIGVPFAPVSPAYSLMSSDFGKLRAILNLVTPGLVFASDGAAFGRAIEAAAPADAELVVTRNPPAARKATMFDELLGPEDPAGVGAANA